jgi:hypothetical protein
MGKPTRNCLEHRSVDMSQSSGATTRPKGGMTPEGYQAMKAAKRQRFAERQEAKRDRKKPKKKP